MLCIRANSSLSRFARLCAGQVLFFRSNSFALRAGQRQGGVFRIPPPYLWTPLSPQRVKGCTPLTIPKMRSKPKNASRFAKRIFLCFSHLRLRRRFHVSAGRYRQQKGNTRCEAANRRNEKKALSAATSFFPFRQLLRGLKGASSPFLVRGKWSPEDERGASKRPSCPLAQRSVRRRCRQQKAYNLPYSKSFCTESHFTRSIAFLC